jgi:hypothetical protein
MNDRNLQTRRENEKDKTKAIWMQIGLILGAIALAVLTVFVINLNR